MPKSKTNTKLIVYTPKNKKRSGRTPKNHTASLIPTNNPRIVGFPRYNNLNPFPAMMVKKMPYTSLSPLVSTINGIFGSQKTFVINSLFNCEPVAGHQPYGFDQLCSASGPYTQYKVLKVRAKVTVNNESSVNFRLGTCIHNTTSNFALQSTAIAEAAEKPNVRLDFISNTGAQSKTFVLDIPIYPLFNWTKSTYDLEMSNLTSGTYNTNPLDLVHLDFAVAGMTANAISTLTVEFMFETLFFDRFIMSQS
jgi:hypothetical protein